MPANPPPRRSLALRFSDVGGGWRRPGRGGTVALAALGRWALHLSPRVAMVPPDGLLVDLADCTYPFGDEPGLLADVAARLAALGLRADMAVADTPGAAWALARHGTRPAAPGPQGRVVPLRMPERAAPQAIIAPPGPLREALAPLPVSALRLPDDTLAALGRLGLTRIGDVADLPRAAIARRFGPDLLRRLDQATGREAEEIPAVRRPTPRPAPADGDQGLADLVRDLAARLGAARVTRLHPVGSPIPEKSALVLAAAWSAPHEGPWPAPPSPRPLVLHAPEPLEATPDPMPPAAFRWRGGTHALRQAAGPERIAPEWWLDDPAWRSGPRDYWRIETAAGDRLWLFYAHGGQAPGGWFCHGAFA